MGQSHTISGIHLELFIYVENYFNLSTLSTNINYEWINTHYHLSTRPKAFWWLLLPE